MSRHDDDQEPESELTPEERAYILAHSGLSHPFDAAPGVYERQLAESAERIRATQMSFAAVAALLGIDEERLRGAVTATHLGLVMHTPQADLRLSDDGSPMTPLQWLAAGGDPEDVWDLLTTDFSG